MSNELELTVTKIIPAAQKDVFQAWLDGDTLAKFMRPNEGMTANAKSDAEVGGGFEIIMKAGDQEIPHHGEYKEISEYDKLVFTWLSPFSEGDSTVTVTFVAKGDAETEVTLHHVGFPSQESRDNHEGGWTNILAALATTLG